MLRPRFENGASVYQTATGLLRVEVPLQYVARVTFRGHFTDDFVEPVAAAAERVSMTDRKAIAFHDWEGMTGYEMSARVRMLAVAAKNHAKTERIHFFVASTVVRLAVEVANLAVRKFEVHATRRSFEEAYARATREGEDVRARRA
jgi:hypothetical protein